MRYVPPSINGVAASRLQLPPGPWTTVLDCLCARFPAIGRDRWLDRMQRGRVLDAHGQPIDVGAPYRLGTDIFYYREIGDEPRVPFAEVIIHADEHIVVADKPHFLPVMPAGRYVRETLLARLVLRLGNPDLVPLHRIDRDTAGLVLFSANPATRAAYQALFPERRIRKHYEAIAPALPSLEFPFTRASRIVPGEPFPLMCEVEGAPNSESRIEVLAREGDYWRYALEPVTGRKHQLRVHLAGLGAPILNDPFYPRLTDRADDDYSRPLQLLARRLAFADPISGSARTFESGLNLAWPPINPAPTALRDAPPAS